LAQVELRGPIGGVGKAAAETDESIEELIGYSIEEKGGRCRGAVFRVVAVKKMGDSRHGE